MLDKRLKTVYSLIPGGVLCDVGTDHCKLAVYAVESGLCPHAYATDLRKGPLSAARRTVERHGLSDKITLLLSDGFRDLPDEVFSQVDCFVVAGMGGELIERILRERPTGKPLVLQPQSAVYELCEFLSDGYDIEKRLFCEDGDKLYTAMLCRCDGVKREYDPFRGAVRDGAFYTYLDRELSRIDVALDGMARSDRRDPREDRLVALRERILKEKQI